MAAEVVEHPAAKAARLESERDELADALATLVDALDEHAPHLRIDGAPELARARAHGARVLERWGHRR